MIFKSVRASSWPQVGLRCLMLAYAGPSCSQVGPSCSTLAPSDPQVGPKWASSWPQLGPSWPEVATGWPQMDPKLFPSWPQVGQAGPKLAPCWQMFAQGGPKLCHEGSASEGIVEGALEGSAPNWLGRSTKALPSNGLFFQGVHGGPALKGCMYPQRTPNLTPEMAPDPKSIHEGH